MDGNTGFDAVLRSALLDAARADYGDVLAAAEELPEPEFSERYLAFRQRLLADPFAKDGQPFWKKALRVAACILLALGMAGGLVWGNPTTRAWVERYLFLRFEDRDEYQFQGAVGDVGGLGKIKPGYLPEGFQETDVEEFPAFVIFTYENDDGETISYYHMFLKSGGAIGFDNEHSDRTEIAINGINGQLYTSTEAEYSNYLILFDEENGYVYFFSSLVDEKELIKMAESLEYKG